MTVITQEEVTKLSEQELMKALSEAMNTKTSQLLRLRTNETHEQKIYLQNKKLVARIKTELKSRQLTKK